MKNLPELPEANEHGNYPALSTARILLARKLIQRRVEPGLSQPNWPTKRACGLSRSRGLRRARSPPTIATVDKLERVFDALAKKRTKRKR